jgi:hypothetical protein
MKKKTIILIVALTSLSTAGLGISRAFSPTSLMGEDRNANGIRDSVETYIDSRAQPGSQKHMALLQLARDYAKAFREYDRPEAFKPNCKRIRQSERCIVGIYGKDLGYDEISGIMAEEFDNLARSRVAIKMNADHFRSGKLNMDKNQWAQRCEFINSERLKYED